MRKMLIVFRSLVIAIPLLGLLHGQVAGQVVTLQDWSSVYHGSSASQQDIPYSVVPGSNSKRILVVAIASARTPAGPVSVTITYGGQPLTLAGGDMGSTTIQHTALYYLDETKLDAVSGQTLSFTVTGGTIRVTDVWAALFDYVNQTTPITGNQTYSSLSTTLKDFQFGTELAVNAYNRAVEVMITQNGTKQPSAITWAANWTMKDEQTVNYVQFNTYYIRTGVANRSIPVSNTTDASATTLDIKSLVSMTALSLNYEAPPPPSVQASNITFSDITSSSFTINWDPGDGTNRLVLVKEGSAVDGNPADGTTYTASDIFGSGSEIATSNFAVFNGMSNSVTVDNLDGGTTYHVAIYEFSGPAGLEDYLTPGATGSQLTVAETAVDGDYRTNGSGNWATPDIWQSYNGTAWITAVSSPSSANKVITIRNDHNITITAAVTVDQVIVLAGGKISVNPGITLTIADGTETVDFDVYGTLYNEGTVATTGTLAFNSSSSYQHALNGGIIPAAVWDPNSNCLITGITALAPTGFGQSFGNFTWNCPSQTSEVTINSNVQVRGDFTLTSTGSGRLSIINNNSSVTITVSGDYSQTGGTLDFNSNSPGTATTYLNVAGNFSFTGGTITETSASGNGAILFNGNDRVQTYTSGGTWSNNIDFTVESGAFLQMGTGFNPSIISGSKGTFTLAAGATLGITSPDGITATGITGSSAGNIRVTGTRTFDAGANYIYNGSVPQNTNTGLPSTVNSLVFDNTGGLVTLNSAAIITSTFSINSGSKANLGTFTHTTGNLTLGGAGQLAGTYGGTGATADYVIPVYFDAATGIVVNQPPAGTWLGITTDWYSTSNWIGGIPGSGTVAIITPYPANQPLISGTGEAVSSSITINSGASLTIGPSGSASFGSLINNGTLNLNSDGTGIASLIIDSYTDNGRENIELFISGGGDESAYPWHYISSPVTSLSTDVFTIGDSRSFDLAVYNESLPISDKDLRWIAWDGWDYSIQGYPANPVTFNNLEPGKGYNIYFYESSIKKTFEGTLNTSDENEVLSYTAGSDNSTQGWNCLGNPFSSGLDWDAITKPTGVENAIYFTVNNVVASYVDGVSNNGGTGLIPPMQGFFVKANQSGVSLTLPESARVNNFHSRYKGEAEKIPLIRLKIESKQAADETVIRLVDKAIETFDSEFDAYKFNKTGTFVSLWTTIGPVAYSINSIPFPEKETVISIGINLSESGTYTLSATQLQEIGKYDVYLTDKSTGVTVNLKTSPTFIFSASKGMAADRFTIKITSISTDVENPVTSESMFNIYPSAGLINIQTISEDWDGRTGSVDLIDMTGRTISKTYNHEFRKNSLIQIPAAGYKGIYFVKMQSGLNRHVGKVMIR